MIIIILTTDGAVITGDTIMAIGMDIMMAIGVVTGITIITAKMIIPIITVTEVQLEIREV